MVLLAVGMLLGSGDQESAGPMKKGDNMDYLRGKTLRWSFADGPVAGMVFEHIFHDDGTVTWRVVEGPGKGGSAQEKRYTSMKVAEGIHTASYLAASGHTLTVVLNFDDGRVYGFASNDKEWYPVTGTFEVVK